MIGIDEVGRGAWAGPLVVGLVRFTSVPDFAHRLNDSKLVTKKNRQELDILIRSECEWSVGEASAVEIDDLGLTAATRLAIMRGLKKFENFQDILIDGNVNYLKTTKFEYLVKLQVKADQTIHEVMAASIIAKVYRDRVMQKIHAKYPEYGFNTNVGYGTQKHRLAIDGQGYSDVHRLSFKIKSKEP